MVKETNREHKDNNLWARWECRTPFLPLCQESNWSPGQKLSCQPAYLSILLTASPMNKSFGACFRTNPSSHFPSTEAGLFDSQCWSSNRESQIQMHESSFWPLEITSTTYSWKVQDNLRGEEICSQVSVLPLESQPAQYLCNTTHTSVILHIPLIC